MSNSESLQQLRDEYRGAGMPWPATSRQIAEWAIRIQNRYPTREAMISTLSTQISRALREDYATDPQGRRIRRNHVLRKRVDGTQLSFWGDDATFSAAEMETVFQQKRNSIVADCKQLKTDVDSYNENRQPPRPFTLILDFTDDVAEAELAMGILPEWPDDGGDDDDQGFGASVHLPLVEIIPQQQLDRVLPSSSE